MLAEVTVRASALASIAGAVSAADFLDREEARIWVGRELALRGTDGRIAQGRDYQWRRRALRIRWTVISPPRTCEPAVARDETASARRDHLALAHIDVRDGL